MTILQKIFATKREEIAHAKALLPVGELRARCKDVSAPRGFRRALIDAKSKPALVAEVKKASPSMGEIHVGDFDPVSIAMDYVESGANCISVLTDVKYFKGSPEYLISVRRAVDTPILRKDFICDVYQLDEALLWGSDCVLLIVAGLEVESLKELYAEAKHRNLDVLVEVHDELETEVALALGADMIGINNRDLRTFKTDLSTTERVIPMLPAGVVKISESALESAKDVAQVVSYGADAVLIGTAFCAAKDIRNKVREVMGR